MSGQLAKICVVCGEDCSGKPRTKDSHGNYYCRACYEQRLEEVREGRAQPLRPAQPRPAPTPMPAAAGAAMYDVPPVHDDPFAIDPSLIAQEAAAVPEAPMCPACNMPVQPGGVICLNCGCNLRTGANVQTQVYRAPREHAPVWHIVVGVCSIVYGVINLLLQAPNLLGASDMTAFPGQGDTAYATGQSIGMAVGLVSAVWIIATGAGVIMRRAGAVLWMRIWAILNVIFVCIVGSCVGIGAIAASGGRSSVTGLESADMTFIFVVAFIGLAWMVSWPIVVLFWFGRDKVQRDIAHW